LYAFYHFFEIAKLLKSYYCCIAASTSSTQPVLPQNQRPNQHLSQGQLPVDIGLAVGNSSLTDEERLQIIECD